MKLRAIFCLLLFWGLATGGGARAASPEATSDLLTAIASNKPAAALAALEAGADINANVGEGRTPLISAVMFSRPEMVKMLLDRGADPNRRADDALVGNAVTAAFFAMNGTQLIGMGETTAAQHATALEVLKLVVSAKGADLNLLVRRATTQKTPLMIAAEAGAADAVQVLVDAGADPNTMNGGKYTALDYAVDRHPRWSENAASNRPIIVRALLAKGARKDRKPADGVTPTERAKRAGNPEVIALLAAR
jgi:ankyrin repeat protein